MFHNSGKKIMGFVKFVFYANAILVALIVLGITIFMGSEEGAGAALLALLIGAVFGGLYMCIIYLSMLCVYAFGELVQSNAEQTELLRHISFPEKVVHSPVSTRHTPIVPAPEPAPMPRSASRPAPAPAPSPSTASVGKSTGKAVCPHCGARQSSEATKCKYCGTSMH